MPASRHAQTGTPSGQEQEKPTMSFFCGHDGITVWCRECRPEGPAQGRGSFFGPLIDQDSRIVALEARIAALECQGHHRTPELALCDVELGRTPEEIDLRAALAKYLGIPEQTIDMVSPVHVKSALETPDLEPMLAHTPLGPVIIKR